MEVELILFAKTPVPGKVKTRLVPELGEQGAADFAAAMIEETCRVAAEAWPGSVHLQAWPDADHALFRDLARRFRLRVSRQSEGDLGRKMFQALSRAHARGAAAVVMGCDVPQCPAETLRTAHAFVSQGRSAIGPSSDGGYYLIGMNPLVPRCFERISWGGPKVFDTTLKRAASAGVDLIVLQQLTDLDTWRDIEALRATDPGTVGRLAGGEPGTDSG